ncbi:MAG: hypothetical protein ACI4K7_03905 [Oscillospiraceae bacterium]
MKTDDFSEIYKNENDDPFSGQLMPDEYIIWSFWSAAEKKQNRVFMVLFALFWLGFSLLWTGFVYFLGGKAMALFGVLFIAIGVWLLIKSFRKNEPDRYALTNKRVLTSHNGQTAEIILERIVRIDESCRKDGTGDLLIYENYFTPSGTIDTAARSITGVNDPEYVRGLILTERDKLTSNS